MSTEHAVTVVTDPGRNRVVSVIFTLVLVCAALSLGRIVIELVAFVLFTMAPSNHFSGRQRRGWGRRLGFFSLSC
jgi:hypothetical protein